MSNWLSYSSDYFNALTLQESDAEVINSYIGSAQAFIERYCHRVFAQQEFDLVSDVKQDGSLILPNPPIDHISHLYLPSGQWASVANSSTSVTQASFSTSATALYLSHVIAGIRTDTALLFATYPTLTSLQTAIAAVGHGWSLTLQTGFGSYPTNCLIQNQYGSCVNQTASYFYFWEETILRNLAVNPNTGVIEGWGGVSWAYPWTTVWGSGLMRYQPMRVIYTGGFPEVPEPIKHVCANLVISAFQGPEGRVRQETLGAYSYSLWDFDKMPMSDQRILSMYKDRNIG